MKISVHPYIITNGNGAEAVKFYEQVLGAKIVTYHTFGDMPENPDYPLPEGAKDRVMHAGIQIGDTQLMLSDTFPGQPYSIGDHLSVAVVVSSEEKAREIFDKLKEAGRVEVEFQKTDWSTGYGMVIDKYGIKWQIDTDLQNM